MPLDRFDPEYSRLEILFTLALGIALGVAVAGLWLLLRGGRANRFVAIGLTVAGVLGVVVTASLAYDAGPYSPIRFQMKPYAASIAEAASLMLPLLGGAAFSAAIVLTPRRVLRQNWAILPALAACALASGLVLQRVDDVDYQRHPDGTITSETVQATRLIEGLDSPVGLAVAPNGDLAVIELLSAQLHIYSPSGDGFKQTATARLPMAEDALGFHVVFHPDYPRQPYVYATATDARNGKHVLVLVRGRVESSNVTFDTLIDDLPAADITRGNGSGIAFCKGFFFLGTGDTEITDVPFFLREPADDIRGRAQDISDPRGKIFRRQLEGIELEPAPLMGTDSAIYAFGFRNPFGMTCDERTGYPIVAENGENGHDQVRIIPPGTNHEWPLNDERNTLVKPLLDSGNAHLGPTGVAERTTPDGFELVVSTFESQSLYLLPLSAEGEPGRLRLLVNVEGASFSTAMDTGGCVYFSSADAIWRLDDGRCGP